MSIKFKGHFKGLFSSGLLLAAGLGFQTAQAMPLAKFGDRAPAPRTLGTSDPAGTVDFTAIVALSNCSGSLIRFETSLGADPGIVMTNGHCLGEANFLQPGEVRQNAATSRTFTLLQSDAKTELGTLNADQVLYATMTGTDITLYRLKETYDQIEKSYGVRALTLSSKHPDAGRGIAVVSGYWRTIYNCSIDRFIYELREGDWTFKDSIRYKQPGCETIGGTSGSPIIDAQTHEVIGINNTGNENGEKCTLDNPCEVDAQGNIVVEQGAAYGQETYMIYSCLTGNQIDLAKPGCQLAKPSTR